MMRGGRLLDDQQDAINRLQDLIKNFDKEGLQRRTYERLQKYENDRSLLWGVITRNHDVLNAADPPEEYLTKYNEICVKHKKMCDKMKTWVVGDDSKPTPSQASLTPFIPTSSESTSQFQTNIIEQSTFASEMTQVIPSSLNTNQVGVKPAVTVSATNTLPIPSLHYSASVNLQTPTTSNLDNLATPNTPNLVHFESPTQNIQNNPTTTTSSLQQHMLYSHIPQINPTPAMSQINTTSSTSSSTDSSSAYPHLPPINPIASTGMSYPTYSTSDVENLTNRSALSPQRNELQWNRLIDEERNKSSQLDKLIMLMAENQISNQSMKPPKVQVDVFSGEFRKYREFKELFFQSLKNAKWSQIELFIYLKTKLKDNAYKAIENLEVTNDSYTLAWKILDRKYTNQRKLISTTIEMLTEPTFHLQYKNLNQLINFVNVCQNGLANIHQLKCSAEDILIELVLPKLDETTRCRFEDFIGHQTTTPTFTQLIDFFDKEQNIWENQSRTVGSAKGKTSSVTKVHVTNDINESEIKCLICNKNHKVIECDKFLSSNDRESLLRRNKICIFCTKHKYKRFQFCRNKSQIKCNICSNNHLTLMHPVNPDANPTTMAQPSTNAMLTQGFDDNVTILPTAVATLIDSFGNSHNVRCLIDLCAERTYVSEHIVQKLRLKRHKTKIAITGINGIQGKATSFVTLELELKNEDLENIVTEALVVPRITGNLPTAKMSDHLTSLNYDLADAHTNVPSMIGALLGGDIVSKLFKKGVPNEITPDGLLLQPTHLGWIVSGRKSQPSKYVSTYITLSENVEKLKKEEDLTKKILNFYEIPDINDMDGADDDYCENLFVEKHYRTTDGRYVVPIPWRLEAPELGLSYRNAVRMFMSQENKWKKDHNHYQMSNEFMQEYINLGHMTKVNYPNESDDSGKVYYIPYISIIRETALTTKLRNVFNASMPTSNGISLNDLMYQGPKLQTSIKDILLRGRTFKYIYSADIAKMFRQIRVLPSDGNKMRIIWRPNSESKFNEYSMTTVTYGTESAPFLAIRTIHQCANDNASPEIAEIIKQSFYVDDLLYGADTIEIAKEQIYEIKTALSLGQFPLTKWMSNCPEILEDIPPNDRITSYLPDQKNESNNEIKLLGVKYNFTQDNFCLNLPEPKIIKNTKRGISSIAASFFDPLGFILPFVMLLRIFLQNIWKLNVGWDDPLTDDVKQNFAKCIANVMSLNSITIPRHLPNNERNEIEIIGFADASSQAQAAVLYSRIKMQKGYKITLLTAKGNVAKIKTKAVLDSKQTTIPKLELEALVTLAELFKSIKDCFSHRTIKFIGYTDSQIALSWIRSKTRLDKKFVARRVEKIRAIIDPKDIHHVSSSDNPADPASRGLTAQDLCESNLWFNGPSWLQEDILPTTPFNNKSSATMVTQHETKQDDMFQKFSSWTQLLRVVSYCLRWKHRASTSFINSSEIRRSKLVIIRYYQYLVLHDVIANLQNNKSVPKRHWLYNLSPFIDPITNLVLVGGRLHNALKITENQRHPIIFPKCHGLTIFIRFTHLQYRHAGNSLMLRILIENYWIPGIRSLIKTTIRKCITCVRWRAQVIQPEMAQLPKERVTPSQTFEKIGVDLCGPFSIKASPLKFDRSVKVWVANFVCLSTKAVHLEILSNLTSESFLATFSRFCARRGTSTEIWSDNGTNFVGANRMLKEVWEKLLKDCQQRTAIQEIDWKFIPKHSPTFGGLWEACVKSLKFFVKRMTAIQNLTFEEFNTLICTVEALLNSRPLCQNPINAEDEPALTPFHFINQRGFKPNPSVGSTKIPLTKKWLAVREIQSQFWDRFKYEYLRELQVKSKWQKPQENLEINDIVLVKQPSVTPGDWKLGKVIKTYPDQFGVVRKVNILSQNKASSLHAVNQLVPLLKEEETDQSPNEENSQKLPRRSPRNIKPINILQYCLVVSLVLCSPVKCSTEYVKTLASGIHIRHVEPVYLKAFDIPFSINTGLNMTNDLISIRNSISEFTHECHGLTTEGLNSTNLCKSLISSVQDLGERTVEEIQAHYRIRQKRWVAAAAKGLWHAGPTVLSVLGISYQQYQINGISSELEETKKNLQKTKTSLHKAVSVLSKKSDLEFNAVEGKLNELIQQQQILMIEEMAQSYVQQIEILFERVKSRHINIGDIRPLKELLEYIKPVTTKIESVQLPPIGDEIFDIYPVEKTIVNDVTILTFKITFVKKIVYNSWMLITVPTLNNQQIALPNHKRMYAVITNSENTTIADVEPTNKLYTNIFYDLTLQPITTCLSNIFKGKDYMTTCELEPAVYNEEVIHPIGKDRTIVFRNHNTIIECNKTIVNEPILSTVIINSSICSVVNDNKMLPSYSPITLSKPSKMDNRLHKGSNKVISPFDRKHSFDGKPLSEILINPGTNLLIVVILILAAIMIIISTGIICYREQPPSRWATHWEGPRSFNHEESSYNISNLSTA